VTCGNSFRFQAEESKTTEEKLTGVEPEEKVALETIEPEYEVDDEPLEESAREEKKIDPLVVDVERKTFKPDYSDMDDSKKPSEEEQPEGRFFLKDKLCALGLADCSNDKRGSQSNRYHTSGQEIHHGSVKYVQPVKVIPHGSPIPAIPLHNYDPSQPSYNPPKPSYNPPSSSYGAPSKPTYNANSVSSYSPPKPSYDPPKPSYNPPKPSYNPPKPSYDPPKPSYDPPKPSYNPPKPSYNPPSSSYGAPKPTYNANKPSYNNKPTYTTNSISTGSSYSAPKPNYRAVPYNSGDFNSNRD
jgi:hypothetical protein